jgi:two-component system sensor histidine kinase QseC
MNPSIRRRLLVILLPAIAFAWLVSAITSYFDSLYEQGRVFDAQLAQAAKVLMLLAIHEYEENALTPSMDALKQALNDQRAALVSHPYENRLIFQVWQLPGRQMVLHSEHAPLLPLAEKLYGYTDTRIGDELWRVFTITNEEFKIRVDVAENYSGREELARIIAIRVMIPLFVVIPILALVLWFAVGRALFPLRRLALEVKRRKPTHLDPVNAYDAPVEITPVMESLNTLFERLQRTFDNERRFTADAAHELRTPLAGIKIQAQVVLRDKNEQRRRQAAQHLISAVDRTSRLVEQLLTLARLDPETGIVDPRSVRLGKLAAEVIADLASLAFEKRIDISMTDECNRELIVHQDAMSILIRNLVDNALRYTPRGGIVEVAIKEQGDQVVLSVIDSGPGIPDEERPRVLERFYRLTQAGVGSGLGLSIVQRIAQLHRGTMELRTSRYGGLQIDVTFPLAPPPK